MGKKDLDRPKRPRARLVDALILEYGQVVLGKASKRQTYELEISLRPGCNEKTFNVSRKIREGQAKRSIIFTCPLSGSQVAVADMVARLNPSA